MDNQKEVLECAKRKIEEALFKGMEKALLIVEADGKRNCTVDEGELRASITHKAEMCEDEIVGAVGTPLKYAPYVHNGTGIYAIDGDGRKTPWVWKGSSVKWSGWHRTEGQKPNPFLQKAIDSNRDKIAQIFKEATESLK